MLLTESKEHATVALIPMQNLTPRQLPSTITSKGQVTIPAEVRRLLGVGTSDKVAFQITCEGDVFLTVPQYRSLAELAGAAGKLRYHTTVVDLNTMAKEH